MAIETGSTWTRQKDDEDSVTYYGANYTFSNPEVVKFVRKEPTGSGNGKFSYLVLLKAKTEAGVALPNNVSVKVEIVIPQGVDQAIVDRAILVANGIANDANLVPEGVKGILTNALTV